MLAKKCDRCKKLYEYYMGKYERIEKRVNTTAVYHRYADGSSDKMVESFDLCPCCMEDLVKYLTDPDSEVV